MTRIFTCSCFLFLAQTTFAQRDSIAPTRNELTSLTRFDITLPGTYLTRETKLGKNLAAEFTTGIGYGIGYSSSLGFMFEMEFAVTGMTKFYYNRERRLAKGKSTRLNAGNYFALDAAYTQTLVKEPKEREVGVHLMWGMQRPIGKRWLFIFRAGAGYGIDFSDPSNAADGFYPTGAFYFSYILNKRGL